MALYQRNRRTTVLEHYLHGLVIERVGLAVAPFPAACAERSIEIVLGRRETAEAVPASVESTKPVTSDIEGMELSTLTDELRSQLDLPKDVAGLVVTQIDETSPAFEKGLRSGDVITEAGQEKVASAADLTARIDEARDAGRTSVLLLVRRGADPRFVALPVEKN